MYIASLYWNGSMNVGFLRTFNTEEAAINYVKGLDEPYTKGKFVSSFVRVYEVFNDKPPRLVKIPE